MAERTYNPARAQRHAALGGRISALLRQVEAVAKTKPGEDVPPGVASLAGDLLFEAREFRPSGERRGLPGVAPDHAGLAVQLGQTLAMLADWAARHPAPPDPSATPDDGYTDSEVAEMRINLARKLDQLVNQRLRMQHHAENLPSQQALAEIYPRPDKPH